MALNCDILNADIEKDCLNKAKGGIEVNVVIIPFIDVDKATSTIDANGTITNLSTFSGKTGFFIEGIKQVQGFSWELVKRAEGHDKYKHLFKGVVLTPSAANKKSASNILAGERYMIVVHKLFKGLNQADAFEVLGFDTGLYAQTAVQNSKENDGVIMFELGSDDEFLEDEMPRNNLETDFATTLVAFNNKYATA